MYVQYAPGGAPQQQLGPPNGFFPGGPQQAAYGQPPPQQQQQQQQQMNGAVGSGVAYFPPQQQQVQSPYSSRGMYGQQPGVNMFQTPRDPYMQPNPQVTQCGPPGAGAPAVYGAYPGQDGGYAAAAWAQQQGRTPDYGKPQGQRGGPPPAGGGRGSTGGYEAQPGMQNQAAGAAPAAASVAPQEADPDDDPNRLPTFVKVRGLPAEHDPRIARRPKPKKRAPGVCCA